MFKLDLTFTKDMQDIPSNKSVQTCPEMRESLSSDQSSDKDEKRVVSSGGDGVNFSCSPRFYHVLRGV